MSTDPSSKKHVLSGFRILVIATLEKLSPNLGRNFLSAIPWIGSLVKRIYLLISTTSEKFTLESMILGSQEGFSFFLGKISLFFCHYCRANLYRNVNFNCDFVAHLVYSMSMKKSAFMPEIHSVALWRLLRFEFDLLVIILWSYFRKFVMIYNMVSIR